MNIHHVRRGFATNSSSSHSLIFITGKSPEDYLVDTGEFGWAFFTASSGEARRRYVAIALRANLERYDWTARRCREFVKKMTGVLLDGNSYVDHQSEYVLPDSWHTKDIDWRFFEDFQSFVLQDNLVILGGNDNTEEKHPLSDGSEFVLCIPRDASSRGEKGFWVARKDSRGYWAMFNRGTGTKVRLSFGRTRPGEPQSVDGADAPELVDVKITDRCPFAPTCPYCYQGSTTEGEHASTDSLREIGAVLSKLRVFECAIGGGEPTLHPEFWSFVKDLRTGQGVVPNFTTRNLAWMMSQDLCAIVRDCCGGFAYSVDNSSQVDHFAKLLTETDLEDEGGVQYVVGSKENGASAIMRACWDHDVKLTLLGYKTTGRGAEHGERPDPWVPVITSRLASNESISTLGIDTCLASKHEAELKSLGVPRWCYETKEGQFSRYIDAVTRRIGPSSYCDPSELVSYGDGLERGLTVPV